MKTKTLTYRQAINEALVQEMEKDPSVIIYGIDVADHKRIFGSTVNLLEKFGSDRVFSTPLSEDAMMGLGIGAAISGLKPINVHIRLDFLLLAINQLFNMASSFHYGSDGKYNVPLVVRAIIGKGWGQAYQHSKSLQSVFAHIPGLKVVMPTTPADAKGLLISAIRDNNPVLVLEHRMLYDIKGEVPEAAIPTPFGLANIIKTGKDVTIVATSYSVVDALQAAEILEKNGVSVEIVDPVSITPLDQVTIIKSVNKTKRAIIVDYDWVDFGFSAELATRIYENCPDVKDKVNRLGFAPTPCPCTRFLEDHFYPNAETIVRTVEKKLKLKPVDLSHEEFYSYENKFRGPF